MARRAEQVTDMEIALHYIEKGAGAPLILLHGNGEDSLYFAEQIEHFSKTYRVLAVDTRGHGKSPRGTAPFTIRQFAEDLCAFMDSLSIEKAHLLGFSDGGNIALQFALLYPEKVDKLILNGANLDARGVRLLFQLPVEIGFRLCSLFAGCSPRAKRKAELLGLMVNSPNIPAAELSKVRAKTLVIAGTKDLIRKEHTEKIYRALPDAALAFVPGSHFAARENPAAFDRAVDNFLAR